jgi:SAM-dependent methyltransferase
MDIIRIVNEKILSPLRWKLLIKHLSPFIDKKIKTILDIGAGDGGLSNELLKKIKVKITGVDPYPQQKTFIPIKIFDGKTVPFKDNSFDMAMINDVLHHDNHPEIILNEAKRVSKKYILIKDHYFQNKIDYLVLKWGDHLGNASYGVNIPYNFLIIDKWKKLFKQLNLKIIKQKNFKYNLIDPTKQIIFLLEKINNK